MILDEIVSQKRKAFSRLSSAHPVDRLIKIFKEEAKKIPPARDFLKAVTGDGIRIIAELKKASPSAGVIRSDFNPVSTARTFEKNGAAAISILTEERYFKGNIAYMDMVRENVSLPLMRKDFLLEEYDIYESRAKGADCVLLIARVLEGDKLESLLNLAHNLGMYALVEVHNEKEIERAVGIGAGIIGINNRDLDTLEVDIGTTLRLINRIPKDRIIISESGISSYEDVVLLADAGVSGFLVGESLLRAADIGKKLRQLRGEGSC